MDTTVITPTARLRQGRLELVDQVRLPETYEIIRLGTVDEICEAIRMLRVRGAPALGVAGAYGLLVAIEEAYGADGYVFDSAAPEVDTSPAPRVLPAAVGVEDIRLVLAGASERILQTRPTAVNLGWALHRMAGVYGADHSGTTALLAALLAEADAILREDIEMCMALGRHGAGLLSSGDHVLTHCNTGGLATGGFGTALGVVVAAVQAQKKIHVFADETRPLLQGARLTAWECQRLSIPVTVLVEGAAASLFAGGAVSCVIVGADRIAANGDTANKVGTLGLAVMAKRFDVPFYVAAPSSTIDRAIADGDGIPIEQRSPEEVRRVGEAPVAPADVDVYNPAFDVTPNAFITAIITESGVIHPPFRFDAT